MFKSCKKDFSDFIINKQFNRLENKIKDVNFLLEDIKESQRNYRYSNIMSALEDFEQSILENHEERKTFIQLMAQSKLNIGLDSILREFINLVNFFVQWDELNIFEKNFGSAKYSEKNVERKLNQLCEDYVYLKKGIKTLIDLKISQGIEEEKLQYLFIKLENLDEIIDENKIYNWLPPENEENSWQHQLLYGRNYVNHKFKEDNAINKSLDETKIVNINQMVHNSKKFIKNILKK
ncbi:MULTISPECIES: hypothetical protein [Clostridium]|uniref:RiboL-PSP-HEPN domain-containing protein n=1 Tax=Clostridium aquiflavi TaxID=3073603 RepID=A0ABU1EFS5_9CLOT|nr:MULTISPECIES: hypothetical protein [unclassified Clostridium]MDR5587236.1 hypothetical protein [Clostridium sp. 5N-1]NFG61651.1 hypothetical protein [Clostridium botulinum]NFQ08436.1 hypothetical protein [Clostridium botulinum]